MSTPIIQKLFVFSAGLLFSSPLGRLLFILTLQQFQKRQVRKKKKERGRKDRNQEGTILSWAIFYKSLITKDGQPNCWCDSQGISGDFIIAVRPGWALEVNSTRTRVYLLFKDHGTEPWILMALCSALSPLAGSRNHSVKVKVAQSRPTLCDPMDYSLPDLCPWNSPGQNTGVSSCPLPQGIFPTQWSNPGLPHCRQILYHLSHQGSPRTL